MIRCKFKCDAIDSVHPDSPDRKVRLRAIMAGEGEIPADLGFTKYTPSGVLDVTINNPAALEQLEVGKFYYLDLIPAS